MAGPEKKKKKDIKPPQPRKQLKLLAAKTSTKANYSKLIFILNQITSLPESVNV